MMYALTKNPQQNHQQHHHHRQHYRKQSQNVQRHAEQSSQNHRYILYLLFLILALLCTSTEAQLTSGRNRRRPSLVVGSAKQGIEDGSERTGSSSLVPDQIALAASRTDGQQQQQQQANFHQRARAGAGVSSEPERDFAYGNLEMNLIRPEQEAGHNNIQSQYRTPNNPSSEESPLEDSETAEEYVSKAMKMAYGARLKEPIRIPNENEPHPTNTGGVGGTSSSSMLSTVTTTTTSSHVAHNSAKRNKHNYNYYERLNQQREEQREQQHNQQLEEQKQQQQQQPQHQQYDLEEQQQRQQQAILEAQMQAELQAQLLQQSQLLAVDKTSNQLGQQPVVEMEEQPSLKSTPQQPAPVYEKDPVTRSYDVYDDNAAPSAEAGVYDEALSSAVDRYYRTKHVYLQPQQSSYRGNTAALEHEAEEKIRVSASTDIPKAEIMKQIEKSVLKYMKELEAEGKIITAPKEPAKTYYKVIPVRESNEREESKRGPTATTTRPKYIAGLTTSNYYHNNNGGSNAGDGGRTSASYNSGSGISSSSSRQYGNHLHGSSGGGSGGSGSGSGSGSSVSGVSKHPSKQRYQSETETAYQAPDMSEALAPNVEFIYKIKTRTPLQTATVKTVSKPYTLPLKGNADHFDHSAALKNIEEFDLSHVVTTPENDERTIISSSTSKPQKLYFNSDTYHDINSLPYKAEKLRFAEYRNKLKNNAAAENMHSDYKGYTGYFAEPAPSSMESEKELSSGMSEDGYPLSNPYQFILKKEPLPNKYEGDSPTGAASWEQPRKSNLYSAQKGNGGGGGGGVSAGGSSLEFDSYNPKFNNNPEGYGYQHTYKTHLLRHTNGGVGGSIGGAKRGKRGGSAHHTQAQHIKKPVRGGNVAGSSGSGVGAPHLKDYEANLSLRPPPKK